jgi:hypothetical protein
MRSISLPIRRKRVILNLLPHVSATCPDLLDIDAIQGTERPRGREEPDTVANCEELSK